MNGRKLAAWMIVTTLGIGACQSTPTRDSTSTTGSQSTTDSLSTAATTAPGSPLRILFIGDSFTMDIAAPFTLFVEAGDPASNLETKEITSPGAVLELMFICCDSVQTIQDGDWGVVVLQEDLSIEGAGPPAFFESVRAFHESAQRIGARTVLYMPWEYDNSNPVRVADIAADYATIGEELGIEVAPVGLAWERSLAERPDFDLYAGDNSHSNMRGMYLTTAVLYATIVRANPEGLPFLVADMVAAGVEFQPAEVMTDDDIAFLQRIAWEAVVDWEGR